jgi:YidC/Oxa1 family membrane protein insertase
MDKNTVIGLLMIGAILFGWQIMMSPSDEEIKAAKAKQDSLALVEEAKQKAENNVQMNEVLAEEETETLLPDSAQDAMLQSKFGIFSKSAKGENKDFQLSNDLVSFQVQSKGGRISYLELPDFKTYDSLPLVLVHPDSSTFNFSVNVGNTRYNSQDLYFTPVKQSDSNLTLRALTTNPSEYLEISYTLRAGDYMMDVQFKSTLKNSDNKIHIEWHETAETKEKAIEQEKRFTTTYYKPLNDKSDYLSLTNDFDSETLQVQSKWVSFNQQFFSSTLIAENQFEAGSAISVTNLSSDKYTKRFDAHLILALNNGEANMRWYNGPNKYKILKKYDLDLEDQIDLGWAIFGWINKLVVLNVFNFLEGFNLNYGLIILLLTLVIKLLLSPITYKTYLSSARMKALKPEIDAINAKFGEDDAMKKQQEVMALYQKTGVNPFSGCIPALIQMPILYALFRFFPASIELRQQSFLWAEDLSAFDSILALPFDIPFYGSHVSGFTLLMAISMIFYTKYNMQTSAAPGNNMMAQQMKIMMWMMPVMMLFFFNSYASGLSLYYFTANVTTLIQQAVIKKFIIDEERILAKIEENKQKPRKKSKLQERLAQLAEKQQEAKNRQLRRKK